MWIRRFEDGVGERRIFQIGMPLLHRQLAGDERRATIVSIIQDLQEVAADRVWQRREAEVIYDQQIGLGELAQEGGLALQSRMPEQLVHEPRDAEAAHAVIGSTGGMADGARNEALADAGRPGNILPILTSLISRCIIGFTRVMASNSASSEYMAFAASAPSSLNSAMAR